MLVSIPETGDDRKQQSVRRHLVPDAFVELRRDAAARLQVGRFRFAEDEEGDQQCDQRQRSGRDSRQKIAGHAVLRAEVRKDSAERRSENESHPECCSDDPHPFGAILGRGLVGDVGLRRSDIRAARARNDTRQKQDREAAREGEKKVSGAARGEADQNHRTPSDAVGHPPPHRREEELHDRVDADHHPHRRAAGAVFARVKREERDDHPEADQIDENGEEQDREGRFLHDRRRSVPCRPHASDAAPPRPFRHRRNARHRRRRVARGVR
jgi:hypothetical protein